MTNRFLSLFESIFWIVAALAVILQAGFLVWALLSWAIPAIPGP